MRAQVDGFHTDQGLIQPEAVWRQAPQDVPVSAEEQGLCLWMHAS